MNQPDIYSELRGKKIILPGDLRSEHYPDLSVSMLRISSLDFLDPRFNEILNLNLDNDQGYLGNITHDQALKLNRALNKHTLSVRYANDLLYFLYLINDGKKKAFDENGNSLDSRVTNWLLHDMVERRVPYRAEFFSDRYILKNDVFSVIYERAIDDGTVRETVEQLDEDTLMQSFAKINFEDWVNSPTSQGLPRKNIRAGDLSYYSPTDNSVAWLGAGAGGLILDCNWGPLGSSSGLGMRNFEIKSTI